VLAQAQARGSVLVLVLVLVPGAWGWWVQVPARGWAHRSIRQRRHSHRRSQPRQAPQQRAKAPKESAVFAC